MGLRPSASSLDGVDVVDMGTGFSGALAARLLADLGASVTRVRESGEDDPFAASSAAYRLWRAQQPTVECRTAGEADERLAAADVLLTGGDDHPALPDRDGTAEAAAARHPRLVVLSISGTAAGSDRGALPGNDLLAQARSGLASEQFSDRPIAFGLRLPTYGAVLHGLIGLISALLARDSTGQGDIVRTSFVQGAAGWLTPVWIRAEAPHPAMTGIIPKDVVLADLPVRGRGMDNLRAGDGQLDAAHPRGAGARRPRRLRQRAVPAQRRHQPGTLLRGDSGAGPADLDMG